MKVRRGLRAAIKIVRFLQSHPKAAFADSGISTREVPALAPGELAHRFVGDIGNSTRLAAVAFADGFGVAAEPDFPFATLFFGTARRARFATGGGLLFFAMVM
ncbi:MAG: hypothetical protein PHC88_04435 [Terrimicrobiaceae bacterium]|nr:hypothetical protein [Terrimicrobiaceae bacterium]